MAKFIALALTPMTAEGHIDEKRAAALYEYLIAGGVPVPGCVIKFHVDFPCFE